MIYAHNINKCPAHKIASGINLCLLHICMSRAHLSTRILGKDRKGCGEIANLAKCEAFSRTKGANAVNWHAKPKPVNCLPISVS